MFEEREINSTNYKAHIATVRDVLKICAHDWKGVSSVETFVDKSIDCLDAHVHDDEYFQIHYLVDTDNNDKPVAMCKIIMKNGFKREGPHSAYSRILYVAYVFVHYKYRKLGLARSMLDQVIAHWEDPFYIKERGLGPIPPDVYWALHSGVKLYYSRFGFQPHPLAIYHFQAANHAGGSKLTAECVNRSMTQELLTNEYYTSYRRRSITSQPKLFYDLKASFSTPLFDRDCYVSPNTSDCKGAIVRNSGSTSFIVWCDNMPQDSLQILKFFTDVDDETMLDDHYTRLMSALADKYKERFPTSATPVSLWQTDIAARSELAEKYIADKLISTGWELDTNESYIPMLKKYRSKTGASVDDVVWEDSGFLYFD